MVTTRLELGLESVAPERIWKWGVTDPARSARKKFRGPPHFWL